MVRFPLRQGIGLRFSSFQPSERSYSAHSAFSILTLNTVNLFCSVLLLSGRAS